MALAKEAGLNERALEADLAASAGVASKLAAACRCCHMPDTATSSPERLSFPACQASSDTMHSSAWSFREGSAPLDVFSACL